MKKSTKKAKKTKTGSVARKGASAKPLRGKAGTKFKAAGKGATKKTTPAKRKSPVRKRKANASAAL